MHSFLHLTSAGYVRTLSTRSGAALVGWDCESNLWFKWVFRERHEVKPNFKDIDRFDDLWLSLSGRPTEGYRRHCLPANKASREVYNEMLRFRPNETNSQVNG